MRLVAVALAVVLSEAPGNERAMGMLRDWVGMVDEQRRSVRELDVRVNKSGARVKARPGYQGG